MVKLSARTQCNTAYGWSTSGSFYNSNVLAYFCLDAVMTVFLQGFCCFFSFFSSKCFPVGCGQCYQRTRLELWRAYKNWTTPQGRMYRHWKPFTKLCELAPSSRRPLHFFHRLQFVYFFSIFRVFHLFKLFFKINIKKELVKVRCGMYPSTPC